MQLEVKLLTSIQLQGAILHALASFSSCNDVSHGGTASGSDLTDAAQEHCSAHSG
jgi:hypothetical protein